jgi:acyl-CoA synthetase (AMP-forming)/AMP-acid ligase II
MSNICYRDTIGDMARRAATKYGDKTAIIFRDLKLSFYDLERQSRRFANLMTRYGVQKGDRVAIYAYNSHLYPISMIGLAKIGAIQVPVNYMLNADEIAYVINHSGARIFIVEDILYPIIAKDHDKFQTVEKWGFIPLGDGRRPRGFSICPPKSKRCLRRTPGGVSAEDVCRFPTPAARNPSPRAQCCRTGAHVPVFQLHLRRQYETDDVSSMPCRCFTAPSSTASSCPTCTSGPPTSSCTRRTPWK